MAYTDTQTYDNVGDPDAIVAPVPCQLITLRQDPNGTQRDYLVRAPLDSNPPFHKYPAEGVEFRKYPISNLFHQGEIVGYIETVGGSGDFDLLCE